MTDTPSGTPLPTTNTTASDAAKIVGEIINDAEAPVEAAIIAAQPWMGTVVLKQLWEAALHWVFGLLSYALGKVTGYVVIDIQQYLALKKAGAALIALQAAQKSGDQNAISQASSNVDSAVAPILHYIGDVQS